MAMTTKRIYTGVIFAASTAAASAQPPAAFDSWSVDQGQIAVPCPNGFSCALVAEDAGMLQRELTNPDTGEVFVQSILTDASATGAPNVIGFAVEDFVRIKAGTQPDMPGIASALSIGNNDSFQFNFELLRGSVAPPGFGASGHIDLVVRDQGNPSTATDDMESKFTFDGVGRDGMRVGRKIEISQDLATGVAPGAQSADVQGMHMVVMEGELQSSSGEASLPGIGTLTWDVGDTIVAGWLGQRSSQFGTLGHQAYMNPTTGEQIVVNDFTDPGPFGWPEATFGPAPALPAGTP
jgi:hypothetical protein